MQWKRNAELSVSQTLRSDQPIHGGDHQTFEVKSIMKSFVSHWLDLSNSLSVSQALKILFFLFPTMYEYCLFNSPGVKLFTVLQMYLLFSWSKTIHGTTIVYLILQE